MITNVTEKAGHPYPESNPEQVLTLHGISWQQLEAIDSVSKHWVN